MIYMIRHGQTKLNKAGVLQGRSDHPLNDAGIAQAKKVAQWFQSRKIQFDKVYASPLVRAVQTARIIAGEDREIVTDDRLLEMDYGPYEGTSLEYPAPEIIHFFSDFAHNPAPEGMEQLSSVVGRLRDFLEQLEISGEENILISTHAIAMKGALEYLTPESKGAYWSKYIGNCGVYQTEWRDGGFTVPVEVIWQEEQGLNHD